MDSPNPFGSNNRAVHQYGSAQQTPLYVTDRHGIVHQSSASSHNRSSHNSIASTPFSNHATAPNPGTVYGTPHNFHPSPGFPVSTGSPSSLSIPLAQPPPPLYGSPLGTHPSAGFQGEFQHVPGRIDPFARSDSIQAAEIANSNFHHFSALQASST